MAGAVFGEVGVSLFVAGAALGEVLIDSRSAKCCIFPYKMRLQGRDDDFIVGLCSDYVRMKS